MLLETPVAAGPHEEAITLPEGDAVSDALCDALRELADENDLITAEGLCGSAGLDEGIIAALEQRIGPGPWALARLETLLGTIFASGSSEDHLDPDGIGGKLAGDAPGASDQWGVVGKASTSHWRTRELQLLEDAIDEALRVEDTDVDQVLDEPESEHPLEAEALEAGIARLQETVSLQIITPILEGSSGAEETVARHMLPTFADDVLAVLRKTWRLARIRSQQVQQLNGSLASARSKVEQQQGECEGYGLKAQELLESTAARLNAAKRAVKEKDWELADARRKIEQLERDRASQEQRLRVLETASQRETHARGEAERLLAEAKSKKEAEVSQAAEQEGELRRRLSNAEVSLREVREELNEAELRGEEARLHGEQREQELGAQLSESRHLVGVLQRQLQDAQNSGSSSAGRTPGDAERSGRHRRRSEGDAGTRGAGREKPPRLSLPSQAQLQVVREEAVLGEESEEAREQQRHRRAQKQSDSSEGGAAPPVPSLRGQLPPPAGAAQAPRSQGGPGKPKSLNSLPMDLRGLGKLLTGGGVTPRR